MKPHYFDPELAETYGIEEAIVIRSLQHWIGGNRARGENEKHGRTWTYDTYAGWLKRFPYFRTIWRIRNVFESLVEQGVLCKAQWNLNTGDKTNWYAFADESRFLSPVAPAEGLAKTQDAPSPGLAKTQVGLAKSTEGLAKTQVLYEDSVSDPISNPVRGDSAPLAMPGEIPNAERQALEFFRQHEKTISGFLCGLIVLQDRDAFVKAVAWQIEAGMPITEERLLKAIADAERYCRETNRHQTMRQLTEGLRRVLAVEQKRRQQREREERERKATEAQRQPEAAPEQPVKLWHTEEERRAALLRAAAEGRAQGRAMLGRAH